MNLADDAGKLAWEGARMTEPIQAPSAASSSVGPATLQAAPAVRCPRCESAILIVRHCKALCERCGYVESCEDNFVPNQRNPA